MKKISIISILYNEENSIDPFIKETVNVLKKIKNIDYEIIFINDNSTDKSLLKLLENRKKNKKIKIISLSRRFGPMESIMAGVKYASGDALINIDIDLQDPPQLIPKMINYWRNEKYDVVFTTRTNRIGESLFKKVISSIGYKILKIFTFVSMEKDSGDFRLISRRVINEYKKMNEIYPFFRFMVDWIGFKRKQIFYERKPRNKGRSQHTSFGIIFNFFEISLAPYSDFPVRFSLLLGFISFFISQIVIFRIIYLHFIGEENISSTSIFIAILIFGSLQSLILGLLGLYIGSIHKQTKGRPLYIVNKTYGFKKDL